MRWRVSRDELAKVPRGQDVGSSSGWTLQGPRGPELRAGQESVRVGREAKGRVQSA